MLSVLSQYSLMEQQTTERPFKAYPRTPVSLPSHSYAGTIPSSFYSSYPSTAQNGMSRPDLMTMSMNTQMSATPTASHSAQNHPGQHNQQNLRDMQARMSCFQNNVQLNPTYMDISNFKKEGDDAALGGPVGQDMSASASVSTSADSTSKAQSAELDALKDSQAGNSSDGSSGDGDTCGIMVPPKKRPHTSLIDEPVHPHDMPHDIDPSNLPDGMKEVGYWDKRKKNNESAKRSRDARRMKEEQIALRVVYLEQENLQLRTEVSLLRSEIEKLRCMLYNG